MKFKILIVICALSCSFTTAPDWGFYGHRKINKMAVFTLPPELLVFYKKHIEYLSEHAVDPDKRRYAMKTEFARHYIDIDHWDTLPFNNVPTEYNLAILKFGKIQSVKDGDTSFLELKEDRASDFYKSYIEENRYDTSWPLKADEVESYLIDNIDPSATLTYENEMVKYGIHPYFLEEFYYRLVNAFEKKDEKYILKISADMGHYIGDGHVPLHTTLNYNGEMTNQVGIHAFWESRLPELYADDSYDFFVGKAEYLSDIRTHIWDMIKSSHALLPELLSKEKEVVDQFPEDQQFCYDQRLNQTIWTQCPEFCEAYHKSLEGMVEKRMQDAVLSIGSFWYSAWIDAGQPDLSDMSEVSVEDETQRKALEQSFQNGKIYGRKH